MLKFICPVVILSCCICCLSFNIENRIPVLKVGPKNSLFGLSVKEHYTTENPTRLDQIKLLVGAPTTARARYQSSELRNPGALFDCAVSTTKKCKRVKIDDTEPSLEVNSSNSWLGVTVESQKPGGKVAVCAHRFTIRGGSKEIIWEATVGRCFMLDSQLNALDFQGTYQPCIGKVDSDGTYNQAGYGYCQAGTSFAFADSAEEDIVIGLPGSIRWMGDVYSIQMESRDFFPDSLFSNDGNQPDLIGPHSYLGFSVAAGFNGPSESLEALFVAGAPRGSDLGQVVIFEKVVFKGEKVLNVINVLRGEVLASAFGYDVEVVDITGDGTSDLVVGAPHYYDRINKLGGAVYIYVNKGLEKPVVGPNATITLYGELDSAFGTSITNLGDINMDGFNDIAIGAPNADNGYGKVYIFHGSDAGVNNEPAQVIRGKDLMVTNDFKVMGFGYSLSGGLDMDLNGYPDLAVGSLSDAVVLYRSRPVVNVGGNISAPISRININSKDIDNPNLSVIEVSESLKVLSFNVSVCMNYYSLSDSFNEPVDVSYSIALDVSKVEEGSRPRLSFSLTGTQGVEKNSMELPPQSEQKLTCVHVPVYVDDQMQDKLSPFEMSLTYDVVNKGVSNTQQDTLISLDPIFNQYLANTVMTQVNISKNCGKDEVCRSNLEMEVLYKVLLNGKSEWEPLTLDEGVPVLFAGSEKEIGVQVDVNNSGEDAHQAKLQVLFPNYLSYVAVDSDSPSVFCDSDKENTTLITCELGNPFKKNMKTRLTIRFRNDEQLYERNQFDLKLALDTSSVQALLGFLAYPVSVKVQAQLKIDGYASTDQIPFGGKVIGESAVTKPSDVGLFLNHYYEVINTGKSDAGPVIITVHWPYAISNDKWLFYLLSVKAIGSNSSMCHVSNNILDPLDIYEDSVESSLSRSKRDATEDEQKSRIEPEAIQEKQDPITEVACSESAKCVDITCNLGVMTANKKIYVNITGVVWNSTFLEEFNRTVKVKVFSSAKIFVNRTNVLYSKLSILSDTIVTSILAENINVPEYKTEWWIIVLASASGVLLLVFIVLGLWKCGFFKRKRNPGDFHKARTHQQASKAIDETEQFVY